MGGERFATNDDPLMTSSNGNWIHGGSLCAACLRLSSFYFVVFRIRSGNFILGRVKSRREKLTIEANWRRSNRTHQEGKTFNRPRNFDRWVSREWKRDWSTSTFPFVVITTRETSFHFLTTHACHSVAKSELRKISQNLSIAISLSNWILWPVKWCSTSNNWKHGKLFKTAFNKTWNGFQAMKSDSKNSALAFKWREWIHSKADVESSSFKNFSW